MAQLPPVVTRILPWGVVAALVAVNGWVFWDNIQQDEETTADIWTGPQMPGKAMALPGRPEGVVTAEAKPAPEQKKRQIPAPAGMEQKVVAKQPPAPVEIPKQPKLAAVARRSPIIQPPDTILPKESTMVGRGYVVQVGSFVLKMGAHSLSQRLEYHGMKPRTEESRELVQLNSVQAGPFSDFDEAKQAEGVLKAGGMDALVEETWEGYIITLSKSFLLGYAVQDMEQAKDLGVNRVRMVKVETDLPVRKVLLGPFPDHEKAREVSVAVTRLGLAVPVIQKWDVLQTGKKDSAGG
ncbi:MAG: SPOR domain-containing protein [Magnetococcales bacterium]|nr:SPOR domain-containing protein [Magnetococcales bacterium]